MGVLAGFDPGGEGSFGWCVAEDAPTLPLNVRISGVVNNAREANIAVLNHLHPGEQILAAGIDAPLLWIADDDRESDRIIRSQICALGCPGGTVQHVNSLFGACLVQGMLTGILLRSSWPDLPITEAHPKAFLWQVGVANKHQKPPSISLASMAKYLLSPTGREQSHERDAAIAALSAWAMIHRPQDWQDLYLREQDPYSPITGPLGYWMPVGTDG